MHGWGALYKGGGALIMLMFGGVRVGYKKEEEQCVRRGQEVVWIELDVHPCPWTR